MCPPALGQPHPQCPAWSRRDPAGSRPRRHGARYRTQRFPAPFQLMPTLLTDGAEAHCACRPAWVYGVWNRYHCGTVIIAMDRRASGRSSVSATTLTTCRSLTWMRACQETVSGTLALARAVVMADTGRRRRTQRRSELPRPEPFERHACLDHRSRGPGAVARGKGQNRVQELQKPLRADRIERLQKHRTKQLRSLG